MKFIVNSRWRELISWEIASLSFVVPRVWNRGSGYTLVLEPRILPLRSLLVVVDEEHAAISVNLKFQILYVSKIKYYQHFSVQRCWIIFWVESKWWKKCFRVSSRIQICSTLSTSINIIECSKISIFGRKMKTNRKKAECVIFLIVKNAYPLLPTRR